MHFSAASSLAGSLINIYRCASLHQCLNDAKRSVVVCSFKKGIFYAVALDISFREIVSIFSIDFYEEARFVNYLSVSYIAADTACLAHQALSGCKQ